MLFLKPLPRVAVMLLFWEEDITEGLRDKVKLLFDETIVEHLDIESILFLSERLMQLLCEHGRGDSESSSGEHGAETGGDAR